MNLDYEKRDSINVRGLKDFSRGSTGQHDQLNSSSRYKNGQVAKEES